MEMFAMIAADTFTLPTTTAPNLGGFPNRHPSASTLSISSSLSPVDSMAPPIARPNVRTIPRTCPRKRSRTRRRSQTGDSDDGDENGFYGGDDDGPFGGSGGGGGGKGWNNDGYGGGFNWEESSSSSFSDPAFDVVYKVLCWIVLSNCVHFALKKIFRIVANGLVGDPSREKVPIRLASLY